MKCNKSISLNIPNELYELLQVQSKRYGVTMTSLIRGAIWKEVNRISRK